MALKTYTYDVVTVICTGQQYQFSFRSDDGANPIRNPSGSVIRQGWDQQGCQIVSVNQIQEQELDYSDPTTYDSIYNPRPPVPQTAGSLRRDNSMLLMLGLVVAVWFAFR